MALTHDGRLFGWGWNAHGQCGLGDDLAHVPLPRAVGRLTGRIVGAVACGAAHTVALVDDDSDDMSSSATCYAWGAHAAGQLGHDVDATDKRFAFPCAVRALDGKAGPVRNFSDAANLGIGAADGASMLEQPLGCGVSHSALVTADGALWTWGANHHGQCGKYQLDGVVAAGPVHELTALGHALGVSCGAAHTMVIIAPGRVYAFGLNATGQLGDGKNDAAPCPTPQPIRLPASVVVTSIACGEEFSACVTREGVVLSWGYGGFGQLGHGNTGSMRLPRQVGCAPCTQLSCGLGHVLARTATSGLLSWGYEGGLLSLYRGGIPAGTQKATPKGIPARDAARQTVSSAGARSLPVNLETLPCHVELSAETYERMRLKSGNGGDPHEPTFARGVAAGRHFGLFIGEAVQPMPESEAALLIQSTFRRAEARRGVEERKRFDAAATVLVRHSSEFLARRALRPFQNRVLGAAQQVAAVRVQAIQRGRLQRMTTRRTRTRQAGSSKSSSRGGEAEGGAIQGPRQVPRPPLGGATARAGGGAK